jgi:hypothetical protein
MNRKLGIGIAISTIAAGLAYLYKRRSDKSKKIETPEAARSRHQTEVFAKAKPSAGAPRQE